MEEISGFYIIGIGIICLLVKMNSKSRMDNIIRNGYSTIGKVIDYETKFERIAGEWTWLDYPIISYTGKYGKQLTGFIKYPLSSVRRFSIGEEVEIVIYDGTIYYKHANDNKLKITSIAFIIGGIGYEVYKYWFQ